MLHPPAKACHSMFVPPSRVCQLSDAGFGALVICVGRVSHRIVAVNACLFVCSLFVCCLLACLYLPNLPNQTKPIGEFLREADRCFHQKAKPASSCFLSPRGVPITGAAPLGALRLQGGGGEKNWTKQPQTPFHHFSPYVEYYAFWAQCLPGSPRKKDIKPPLSLVFGSALPGSAPDSLLQELGGLQLKKKKAPSKQSPITVFRI